MGNEILSALLTWMTRASSTARIKPGEKSFGGTVEDMSAGVWIIVFLPLLVAPGLRLFIS